MTIRHTCRLRNRRQLVAIRALACMAIGSACSAREFASRTVTAPQPVARELTLVSLAVVAVGAGCGGLYLSYYASTAAGASIAAVIVGTYAVALVLGGALRARAVA